jgi:hypothetical protein
MGIAQVPIWLECPNGWLERESLRISTNRKLQSLRNSILATLESKARRTAGVNRSRELEGALRPLDESLEEFTRRWETKFERISDCTVDALKNAAVQMARDREPDRESKQERQGILTESLLRSVMSICNPFLSEYETLVGTIYDKLRSLEPGDSESASMKYYEPPGPAGLPCGAVDHGNYLKHLIVHGRHHGGRYRP